MEFTAGKNTLNEYGICTENQRLAFFVQLECQSLLWLDSAEATALGVKYCREQINFGDDHTPCVSHANAKRFLKHWYHLPDGLKKR